MDGMDSDSSSSSSSDDESDDSEMDEMEESPPASPCRSPTPGATVSASTDSLMSPSETPGEGPATLVILDWDDTLYPTSAVSNGGYDVSFFARSCFRIAVLFVICMSLTARARPTR